ncbi:hypothetical protein O9992_18930 [Vibrio lentus]|nr:hypothetical protein [Vibrio lentus]
MDAMHVWRNDRFLNRLSNHNGRRALLWLNMALAFNTISKMTTAITGTAPVLRPS